MHDLLGKPLLGEPLLGKPLRLDNHSLLATVHKFSHQLALQTGTSSSDSRYVAVLFDILGKSRYSDILAHHHARHQRDIDHTSSSTKRRRHSTHRQSLHPLASPPAKPKPSPAARDRLVAILRAPKHDPLALHERNATIDLLRRPGPVDVDALRRLWAVPKVVFHACNLFDHLSSQPFDFLLSFFDAHISHASPDTRVFNLLHWYESSQNPTVSPRLPRTISKNSIASVIKTMLQMRSSPFYNSHMHVAVETVLYALNPDRLVDRFREAALRNISFCNALRTFEHSRQLTGSLQNLQIGKLNRIVGHIRAVRSIEATFNSNNSNSSSSSPSNRPSSSSSLSLRAVSRYCEQQSSLTGRALRRVHERYVRRRSRRRNQSPRRTTPPADPSLASADSNSLSEDRSRRLSIEDFVRMMLAWTSFGSDAGLAYWFLVLDQDEDGLIGVGDVAHFYAERKMESERRNGYILVDVTWLWFMLCARADVSANGAGLSLAALKDLALSEREFVMNALLFRKVDEGKLCNLRPHMH